MVDKVTVEELCAFVENSHDQFSLQYNLHHKDMIDGVVMPEDSYIRECYLPLVFKSHMSLFSQETLALMLHELCVGCAQPYQEESTGLSRLNGRKMSSQKSAAILHDIIDHNLISDEFENPKAFINALSKIDRAADLALINHLILASHTRHALVNNPDSGTAVSSEVMVRNECLMQEFVTKGVPRTADILLVDASTYRLWNTQELFQRRALKPDNKNMSIVFVNFSVSTNQTNTIFYDEHDFKNWLYYHRHVLRRVVPKDASTINANTIAFAANLLEAISDMDYYDFTPLVMVLNSFVNDSIRFINPSKRHGNKLKLYGSTIKFIYHFINSRD